MQRAIELAVKGQFTTTPNPNVGCVLVKDGKVMGEGYHQQAGQAHAEINALNHAKQLGNSVLGATAYVTLEPCSHQGRTGSCAKAFIDAKISKVIIANIDPNPMVSGQGIAKLKSAGIEVITGVLADKASQLNRGFFKRMETGLPFIRVKTAMSLDGKIAMASGESQWITGQSARQDVQQLRVRACAILSTAKTAIADNAKLNVRLANESCQPVRQPVRVIIDRDLSLLEQPGLALFEQLGEIILCHQSDKPIEKNKQSSAVKFIQLGQQSNRIDLFELVKKLGQLEFNEVLVEAGAKLTGALIKAQLLDELIVYQAPIVMGHQGQSAFEIDGMNKLSDAHGFSLREYSKLGQDLKLTFTSTV